MEKTIQLTQLPQSSATTKSSDDLTTEKSIRVSGKHNRYEIKKLITSPSSLDSLKKCTSFASLDSQWFAESAQAAILSALLRDGNRNDETDPSTKDLQTISNHIAAKIRGYKHQDTTRKRQRDDAGYVTKQTVTQLIQRQDLKCHYCGCTVLLAYEHVRDMRQWTLDRINNAEEHSQYNIVLACLECNLKKKHFSSESFLFTKNLCIQKTS